MARFKPLYIRRSDGVVDIVVKGRTEKNEPSSEQLDPKPNSKGVSDYYRTINHDEAKHLDWRRKLGAMLMRELGSKAQLSVDNEYAYILYELPENFRLFEHVKTKLNPGDAQPKNHAAGQNDRQDAFLYGHPLGRKKRYRSPLEFFPHLLWLATDESGDSENCTCVMCAPKEMQPDEPRPSSANLKGGDVVPSPSSAFPTVIPRAPTSQNPHTPVSRPPSAPPASAARPTTKPMANVPKPPVPHAQQSASASQLTSLDQQTDLEYNSFIYRQGELVWFNRGAAWAIGIVVRRFKWGPDAGAAAPTPYYVIQPFTHPYEALPQVTINRDDRLRPWLKWSAPPLMTASLQKRPNLTFNTADWRSIVNAGRPEDAEVDASILAARTVDATYTLIKPLSATNPAQGVREQRFAGLYFGAEKVWVGDALRLRQGGLRDVLLLTEIVERRQTDFATQQTSMVVILMGDIYQLAVVPPTASAVPSQAGLPTRMVREVEVRNSVSQPKLYWKRYAARTKLNLGGIKGRWYEASVVVRVLDGEAEWQAKVASGTIPEGNMGWNGRGDAQPDDQSKTILMPKPDRLSAVGKAIPQTTTITEGGAVPPLQELAAMVQSSQPAPAPAQEVEAQEAEPVRVEDFMDLSQLDSDDASGFQQGFGAHSAPGGGFFG